MGEENCNVEKMNKKKIVVIGAGASGIACATKLLEYGFHNVLVLEAESRIGGRIHTIPFGDNVIDLGAQWCHGEKDNIVYNLASPHNLLESSGDIYDNYQCIRSNKEIVPESVADRLKRIVFDSLSTRQMELRNSKDSLGSYLHKKFNSTLMQPEFKDISPVIAEEFFENYKKFENSVEASDDLNDVSGCGYLQYWECEGELLLNWKDKGYIELLRLLLKSQNSTGNELGLLQGRILFNKIVKHINWLRPDNCVELNCVDGEVILADHVISTVSLGVLKDKHAQMFSPSLPVEKVRAIKGLSFGSVNKFFLEFPEPFWPEDWLGFTLLWRNEDLVELRKTVNGWLEDVFGFYRVSHQPRVLCGWIVGPNARHMETLPESEVLAGCIYLLRKFLNWNIPNPSNFTYSKWFTQSNFGGSYSFRSMLTEELGTSARDLAQPLTVICDTQQKRLEKPVLQFAGEASSDHYYSTVHGAVEAGWREATRLLKFYDDLTAATAHL